jgi:probable rRNA maturation factor
MDSQTEKVHFFFPTPCPQLKNRLKLRAFIPKIFKKEGRALKTLEYVFTSDEEVLEINRTYLKHDFYTDIITFDLSGEQGIEGTIYISVDRVQDNARNLTVRFVEELHRVIFHGALHLCGYRDKTKTEIQEMRKEENRYLALYFKQ